MDLECVLNDTDEAVESRSHKAETVIDQTINGDTGAKTDNEIVSDSDDHSRPDVRLDRGNRSNNIFVELPVHEGTDRSLETLSDSDDSIIFCSDPEVGYQSSKIEKPKDLLSEISEILLSLSDDERFMECINYSNNNSFIFDNASEKRRSSVDIIFTYNVLSILYSKLRELKTYVEITQAENDKLLKENHIAEAEHVAYQVQVETLQKIIDDQKHEIASLNRKSEDESQKHDRENDELQSELKSMHKKYQNVVGEKDAAVMRYVKNESELITIRKEKENLTKRFKNVETERDELVIKLKNLTSEKSVALQTLDGKKTELANALKDIEKLKEELSCKDIKSKWVEENLQKELNRYKEHNAQLTAKLDEVKKNSTLNPAYNSESLCSEGEKLIMNNQFNGMENGSVSDVELLSPNQKLSYGLMNENNSLILKIQKLETERLDYEKNLMNLKQMNENQNQKVNSLQDQLMEMESLRSALKQMQEKLTAYQNEIDRLKETNEDLRLDMDSCREREAELLNFTEKLTAKNVSLQSEYAVLEAKKLSLEADLAPVNERVNELESNMASLAKSLEKEIAARTEDVKELVGRVEEKVQEVRGLSAALEEQQAENQSLKHKYSSTIRELTKEVQQYRKCKQFEATECSSSSDSVCLESRTSSCTSLNEPQLPKLEPDRQTLIERIVKLQKVNARHQEKIEFLEEHVSQLLAEVKKKNRVIQHYVIREQSGALSSNAVDQHKAELSKYGGIMASLYNNNSKCEDGSLSLELSLEINRKLQAVLEDTILKNITLKESMETLGKEIARLTAASTK